MDLLEGTPYSLSDEAEDALVEMSDRMRTVRRRLRDVLENARRIGLVRELDRAQAYWSVFESNSLEFEGPDLPGTVEVIESPSGQDVLRSLNVSLLPQVLATDKRAFAAIGLETARVVAQRYVGAGSERRLNESDLRSLHGIIMAGHWHAGGYRNHDVQISGASHVPTPSFSVATAMGELSSWAQRGFDEDLAVLRAAVGHAWFTHLHPFVDGNGRVARLLTNVMLGQDGLPPAIVKASAQRSGYIAALAHSDEGGDILPLAGLFLTAVERYVDELAKPRAFKRLFDQLVARRGDNYFDWYQACANEFLDQLRLELSLQRLQFNALDQLTRESFDDLREGSPRNVMIGIVADSDGQELVLFYRRPSSVGRARFDRTEAVPTIAFAVPNRRYSLSPYRRAGRADLQGLSEVWVQPDRPIRVFVDDRSGVADLPVTEAASRVVDGIAEAFAARFAAPVEYFGSVRWLPKIHGGPG